MSRPLALLLAAWAAGCAAVEDPPGGPPDFTPPVVLSTVPDSGAVLTDARARVRFQLNETIQERDLAALIAVSPRHEALDVGWHRSAISVRPEGGWRDSVAYVVTLAPGVQDLRGNRLRAGARIIFTTGGPLPTTLVRGTVIDWENGRRARGALVEAIRADSLTYLAFADSAGDFALPFVPPGTWTIVATIEQTPNQRRGPREPFDSTIVRLGPGDTAHAVLWAVTHDTTGPALREARRTDSVTVRLTFDERLAPAPPDADAVRVWLLPDTAAVAIAVLLTEQAWTSRADTATPPADSVAAADSLPPTDSLPAVDSLLAQRPALSPIWYVVLRSPMAPGARYLIEATAASAPGYRGTSRTVLAIPDTVGAEER